MSCVTALVAVFMLLVGLAIGLAIGKKKELEKFANDMYSSWKTELANMGDIGKPPGYLSLGFPEKCDTSKNIMIQSNVAFRPVRQSKGCMEVVAKWP